MSWACACHPQKFGRHGIMLSRLSHVFSVDHAACSVIDLSMC